MGQKVSKSKKEEAPEQLAALEFAWTHQSPPALCFLRSETFSTVSCNFSWAALQFDDLKIYFNI